ncbi:MAG: DUF6768 family protein [Phycisphaerales bacterium JB040]
MTNVDDIIRDALREEDRDWFDRLGEPGPIDQVLDSFRTRNRFFVILAVIFTFVMMGGAVYTGYHMFNAAEVRETIWWAMGLFFCIQAITALKIWFWMEMARVSTIRETKRLELQVARLASRLAESGPGRAHA